jgi:hypothetical protein
VTPIAGYPDAFELTRVVDGANASLELYGTAVRLFVHQVVVVDDGHCRTESYSYRLQADASLRSWLIRWEYVRDPPESDYAYPRAHVHVNGSFPDEAPIGRVHIASRRVSLELVVRNLISDWGVKPRCDDWEAILGESVEGFEECRRTD